MLSLFIAINAISRMPPLSFIFLATPWPDWETTKPLVRFLGQLPPCDCIQKSASLWCGRHCLMWVCDDHDEVILDGRQAKGLQLDKGGDQQRMLVIKRTVCQNLRQSANLMTRRRRGMSSPLLGASVGRHTIPTAWL